LKSWEGGIDIIFKEGVIDIIIKELGLDIIPIFPLPRKFLWTVAADLDLLSFMAGGVIVRPNSSLRLPKELAAEDPASDRAMKQKEIVMVNFCCRYGLV
jgi:hypothetical protein